MQNRFTFPGADVIEKLKKSRMKRNNRNLIIEFVGTYNITGDKMDKIKSYIPYGNQIKLLPLLKRIYR